MNSNNIYCTKCGKENKTHAKFCHYCGHDLTTDKTDEEQFFKDNNLKEHSDIDLIPTAYGLKMKKFSLYTDKEDEEEEEKKNLNEMAQEKRKKGGFIYLIISSIICLILLLLGENITISILKHTDPNYIVKITEWQTHPESAQNELQNIIRRYTEQNGEHMDIIQEFVIFTGASSKLGLLRITLLPLLISALALIFGGILNIKLAGFNTSLLYIGINGAISMSILVIAQGNLAGLLFAVPFGFIWSLLGGFIMVKISKSNQGIK